PTTALHPLSLHDALPICLVGDLGQRLQVRDDAAGVGQALAEDRLGLRPDRALHCLQVVEVDEVAVPVELPEGFAELGDRAAVERSEEHTSELQSRENLVC